MDLFSRRVLLTGSPAEYVAWAVDMCGFVNERIDDDVTLWAASFGAPAGTMVYSAWTDGVASMAANTAKLMADSEYIATLAAAQQFVAAPSQDSLARPIHGEPTERPGVGSVATVTSAVIANGAYAAAVGWGIEMAQLGESIAGIPTTFLMNSYGTFGQVTWIGVSADAASHDAAGRTINENAEYMAKLADIGDLFVPGSGHRTMATRIA